VRRALESLSSGTRQLVFNTSQETFAHDLKNMIHMRGLILRHVTLRRTWSRHMSQLGPGSESRTSDETALIFTHQSAPTRMRILASIAIGPESLYAAYHLTCALASDAPFTLPADVIFNIGAGFTFGGGLLYLCYVNASSVVGRVELRKDASSEKPYLRVRFHNFLGVLEEKYQDFKAFDQTSGPSIVSFTESNTGIAFSPAGGQTKKGFQKIIDTEKGRLLDREALLDALTSASGQRWRAAAPDNTVLNKNRKRNRRVSK